MRANNSKVILIARIVAAVVGFLAGSAIMWRVTDFYNLIPKGAIKFLFYIVAGLVLGTVLLLSAPSIVQLVYSLGEMLTKAAANVTAITTALCFLLSAVVSVLVAILAEYLLSLVFAITELRIIFVVIIAIAVLISGIALCAFVASSVKRREKKEIKIKRADKGYLLSAESLGDERITEVCNLWLSGKIYVLKSTVDGFFEKGNIDALRNYKTLSESGRVKTVNATVNTEDGDERGYAARARLKIVVKHAASDSDGVTELALDGLSAEKEQTELKDSEKTID